MIIKTIKVSHDRNITLKLGRQGEHRKIAFKFDCNVFAEECGAGKAELYHLPYGEEKPCRVDLIDDGNNTYTWIITASDTAIAGTGKAQMAWRTDNGGLALSEIIKATVSAAID